MQGKGQLLASSLLVASLLGVLAHNKDGAAQPSQLSKRSADDMDDNNAPWGVASPDDVSVAQKRFNEFVGKRAEAPDADKRYEFVGKRVPYEFVGKRPYEFLGKRTPYEFLGKRMPYEFLGKRTPYEFVGKRPYEFLGKRTPYEFLGKRPSANKRALFDFYGKRVTLPYEFVGKRIFGSAWERLSTNTVEDDALVKDVTDVMKAGEGLASEPSEGRSKRYSEWLGKRSQISDQLLRQLVNKRISALVRQRLQNKQNPEFIGRREEEENGGQEGALPPLSLKKRYTEFVGK